MDYSSSLLLHLHRIYNLNKKVQAWTNDITEIKSGQMYIIIIFHNIFIVHYKKRPSLLHCLLPLLEMNPLTDSKTIQETCLGALVDC